MKALIFDVDGTLADTERDGHRVAFNRAFQEEGLGWHWDTELYGRLLAVGGGKERIGNRPGALAECFGDTVSLADGCVASGAGALDTSDGAGFGDDVHDVGILGCHLSRFVAARGGGNRGGVSGGRIVIGGFDALSGQ